MQKRENNQAKDARSAALTILLRCERNGAWLDGALKSVLKESALEPGQKEAFFRALDRMEAIWEE